MSHSSRTWSTGKSRSREIGPWTTLGHKTSVPRITVHYRFHPLAGKQFRPVRVRTAPPPTFVVELSDSRLAVPAWMTEEKASKLELVELPSLDADSLLRLAALVERALDHDDPDSCILSEDTRSPGCRSVLT